jgi:hypothetical protein
MCGQLSELTVVRRLAELPFCCDSYRGVKSRQDLAHPISSLHATSAKLRLNMSMVSVHNNGGAVLVNRSKYLDVPYLTRPQRGWCHFLSTEKQDLILDSVVRS